MSLLQLARRPEYKIFLAGFSIMLLGFVNLLFLEKVDFLNSYAFKQALWILIALVGSLMIRTLRLRMLKDISIPVYIVSLILLILVLVVGERISGSKSWIKIGSLLSFQPSEFAKITLVFIIAKFYSELGLYSKSYILKYTLGLGFFIFPFLLIIIQPDLGSGFMLFVVTLSVIFSFSYNRKILLAVVLFFGLSAVPIWNYMLEDYQKERIINFVNPERDPSGHGYNAIQSKIAIGSGKIFGKGLGKSSQGKFKFLPEKHTDFAFSIWAEQTGLIGSTILLGLFAFLVIYPLSFLNKIKDQFLQVLLFGMCSYFFFHFAINICMTIGLFPIVGIPMVMFSYGGSSLLCATIALAAISLILRDYKSYETLGV
jgi:rod shape determining protein RodA